MKLQKACVVTFLAVLGCLATTTLAQLGESQVAIINMGGIVGKFTFSPLPDTQVGGGGANVVIAIESGLTRELEIQRGVGFEYHIHVKQVGANNNCEATGGHLDPDPAKPGVVPCDPSAPDKCQVGDLSGKHGNLEVTPKGDLQLRYIDAQLKFTGDATTILGRSLVIHNNGARIACANILPASQTTSANGLPMPLPSASQQDSSTNSSRGASGSAGINGRARSSNAHPSEGRFMSSEAMWTAVGSVACGVIAALMAF
ncbi:MAG: superoxide dismutase [Linnemannia elongata]|nr:MAG: superoxide dismutase [Linnemannia elongata]